MKGKNTRVLHKGLLIAIDIATVVFAAFLGYISVNDGKFDFFIIAFFNISR